MSISTTTAGQVIVLEVPHQREPKAYVTFEDQLPEDWDHDLNYGRVFRTPEEVEAFLSSETVYNPHQAYKAKARVREIFEIYGN